MKNDNLIRKLNDGEMIILKIMRKSLNIRGNCVAIFQRICTKKKGLVILVCNLSVVPGSSGAAASGLEGLRRSNRWNRSAMRVLLLAIAAARVWRPRPTPR